jgi:hypothetical protein
MKSDAVTAALVTAAALACVGNGMQAQAQSSKPTYVGV